MEAIAPSVDVYNIEIEVLSPVCVGGTGDDGRTKYESFEYVIDNTRRKIFFINDTEILTLISEGLINEEDLDLEYSRLIKRIFSLPGIDKYIRSLNMNCESNNKLQILRFASIKEIDLESAENGRLVEKYVIPGSTIKGMLKTGYAARKMENCEYEYIRIENKKGEKVSSKLKLESIKINRKRFKNDNNVYTYLFNMDDYDIQVNMVEDNTVGETENWISLDEYNKKAGNDKKLKSLSLPEIFNILSRNIICRDFELVEGEIAVEKAVRIDRRIKKENAKSKKTPIYFEAAQPGAKFCGEVRYKNDTCNYGKQLSIVSIQSRDFNFPDPVLEALNGLKKMGRFIIEAERSALNKSVISSKVKDFYNMLEKENESKGTAVFKLGYAGILAKSWMVFDDVKIKSNDEFMPYTTLASEKTKLPMGWVKIRYDF